MSSTVLTEFAGYTARNYGPLTTTFTGDPSCATTASINLIAQDGTMLGSPDGCAITKANLFGCYPSSQKVSSLASENLMGLGYFPRAWHAPRD